MCICVNSCQNLSLTLIVFVNLYCNGDFLPTKIDVSIESSVIFSIKELETIVSLLALTFVERFTSFKFSMKKMS